MLEWSHDLVDHATVRVGERVVDLACGTGFAARIAATRVGESGRVISVDINTQTVAVARRVRFPLTPAESPVGHERVRPLGA
jgi:ubiquinone/menaquinone biosynthesis C-methylase UbiE